MARLEVKTMRERSADVGGEVELRVALDNIELDIRVITPNGSTPQLYVNERLAGGGVRRKLSAELAR